MSLPRPSGATLLATINTTPIWWDGTCLSWRAGLAIDDDGDPACYGPNGKGRDRLANAGHPGNWWGIVTDKNGAPVLQGPNDPCPGFYISTTSYVRPRFALTDPRRYINAQEVPGVVVPGLLIRKVPGVVMGCAVEVTNERNGITTPAMVHDSGPGDKVGEGTPELARRLGLPDSVLHGGTDDAIVTYRLYPGRQVTLNGETFALLPAARR